MKVGLHTGWLIGLVPLLVAGFLVESCRGGQEENVSAPLPNGDTVVVKVAVVYDDPVVKETGLRLHESCRLYNPHDQLPMMTGYMNEASHGVVRFEVALEIEADTTFSYYTETRKPVSADDVYGFYRNRHYPQMGDGLSYDYAGMVKHYGFDKLRNEGTIDEVWVYTHPSSGMFETCMAGPGAFWVNGDVFDVPTLEKKLTVLYCNYERTVDLAMHSYAHYFENVMTKVYGRCDYDQATEGDLNNWERFSSNNLKYDRYEKGAAHVGNCHFPANAVRDYDYENTGYVMSYCDAWDFYPDLSARPARQVNCSEWGNTQLGYMRWFYGHVPHFAGVNPADGHLNNWWYYLVDFDGAMAREKEQQ
jgi:hypothetical protein